MAGFIRYEQAPAQIGFGDAESRCGLLATTLTAGENLPLTAVRALGFNGAVAVTSSGPVDGTWSVTYHLVNTANSGADCGTTTAPPANCADFYGPTAGTQNFVMQRGFALTDKVVLRLADEELFQQGIATSYTIAAEPNAVVTATLAGNYYDCAMGVAAGGLIAQNPVDGGGDLNVAHGSKTNATGSTAALGFSCAPFSVNYEASRGLTPIYTLGNLSAVMVMITDPQQTLTMQGENMPKSVLAVTPDSEGNCSGDAMCLAKSDIAFDIKDICPPNAAIAEFAVCGFVQSRDIEVAENDVLRGNITIVDYTFKQNVDVVTC